MKVAVVGSGVSGLAATWVLNEFSDHEVHLYEAADRPGGHANTVKYKGKDGNVVDVDTGFIVFNPSTYPNLLRFLQMHPNLREAILPTEMTMSVSRNEGELEWAGKGLSSFFAQPSRVLDRKAWRLLYDIFRFNACARQLIAKQDKKDADGAEELDLSVGTYLKNEGYSDEFRDDYLIPMTSAIWSTPPDKCALDFPARTLIQFMNNHHLLQITGKPSWLTLRGGSHIYVNQILSSLPASRLHLNTPIQSISTEPMSHEGGSKYKVHLKTASGGTETFDHVILACHSDEALRMLRQGGGCLPAEEHVLSAFRWSKNEAVLHSDPRTACYVVVLELPHIYRTSRADRQSSRAGVIVSDSTDCASVHELTCTPIGRTYWMNDLQHISETKYGDVFVTLNPPFEPDPKKVAGRWKYEHPVVDSQSMVAQKSMPTIQNIRGISYAGAWLKYGFHEDGFTSGLRVAVSLEDDLANGVRSIKLPFDIRDAEYESQPVLLGYIFDVLERSGLTYSLGGILGMCLDLASMLYLAVFSRAA